MTARHPLVERAREAPQAPGVYRFRDAEGTVLYVGKARDLRKRVLSYFRNREPGARTARMLALARNLDFTVTATEVEALVLENTLIKRHRPRFNVLLKDDKTYPYIKVTTGETWPRVELTRRVREDGHTYFGPFMGQYMARRLMDVIRTRFLVRTCRIDIDGSLPRPCLYHHMHACLGPCIEGLTTPEEYASAVKDVLLFLSGRTAELVARLESSMWTAAGRDDFERAAAIRDLIAVVRRLGEPQNVELPGRGDADVLASMTDGEHATVCVLPYRDGKLVDKRELHFEGAGDVDAGELLASFIAQFYEANPAIPPVIDTAQELDPDDRAMLEAFLGERRGRKVTIAAPMRGPRVRRVELALANARAAFALRFRAPLAQAHRLERRLGEALGLPGPVRRLECFDISHAGGKDMTASCVVWESGRMNRKAYRSFLIRSVSGVDDCAAIAEAVGRRYRRLRDEHQAMPDLVLIDGGPGQLNAATAALDALGVDLPVAALAKREELIFLPDASDPLRLDRSDPAHLVLRQARDEAHRFAVSRHRRHRRTRTLASELLNIPGIGPGRARTLLTRFGSLSGVQKASADDLEAALGPRLGRTVWRHLHETEQDPPPS
ncbi:MAG: excinuclease ABC subunit UvrC [Acidobacteria bacterium]|nr:excinuclease ABC subunit UvrC [Acidobacteriota bacterium]